MSIVLRSRKTLAQRYRGVLKKYSTSHLWDFGVAQGPLAYAASHTAAEFIAAYPLWPLWQDTAGTVPACKINDPIGLCLDQPTGVVTLGPELAVNGDNETGVVTSLATANGSLVRDTTKYKTGTASAKFTANSATSVNHQFTVATIQSNQSIIVEYDYFVPTGSITLCRAFDNDDGSWFTNTANGSVKDQWVHVQEFRAAKASVWNLAIGNNVNQSIDGQSFWLDNISIREVIGAHASQATTTKRPILSGRVNLLTSSESLSGWTFSNVSGTATRVGNTLTFGASAVDRCSQAGSTIVAGASYLRSITLSGSGSIRLYVFDGTGATLGTTVVTLSATPVTYTQTLTLTSGGAGGGIGIYNNAAGTAGAVVNFINADLRPANSPTNIPAYQRVTSATDYDTVGFPVRALFDGVDDCLVVPSLDLSMTDKVTVVAGIQKLSDAARAMVMELGNTPSAAVFHLSAPNANAEASYGWRSAGTSIVDISTTAYASPVASVVTGIGDISGKVSKIKVNGVVVASSTASQGTGTYALAALNIGQRSASSLPFNGAIQSLAVIGNLLPAGEVQILEAAANAAMGKVY